MPGIFLSTKQKLFFHMKRFTRGDLQIGCRSEKTIHSLRENFSEEVHFDYELRFLFFSVVSGAYYKIFSRDTPEIQSDITLNYCWTSRNGRLMLLQKCQFFKVHVPSLHNQTRGSGSFESACFPGYFLRQKNYQFVLEKRDGSHTFGELCTTVTIQMFSLL